MIKFDREICRNLETALQREWLETNGLGGFASSTMIGLNTRRYHGLLVAATKPPVGRMVLLSKLEETLVLNGIRFDLSANRYPGVIHPQGYQYVTGFRLDPHPVFTYEIEGVVLEKSVFMVDGENTTVIQYRILKGAASGLNLELRPLIAFRDNHSTTHENASLNSNVELKPALASVTPYAGLPTLYLAHNAETVDSTGFWYRNFQYQAEQERGLDFVEDLYSPMTLKFDLYLQEVASMIAGTEPHDISEIEKYREKELKRRKKLLADAGLPASDELISTLLAAADQFIVRRGDQKTIIAGYHWFSDWGRDTMIALPGLTLVTGREEIARSILLAFAAHVDRGMLPNRFPDEGEEPEYNTVDATLWFFEAVRALSQYAEDYDFIRMNLYEVLADIIEWHIRGTRYGIRVDEDGLLVSGEPGVQLTWMDAKVGDWVVTPRHGKAVEIQALWYHALRVMEQLASKFGDAPRAKQYGKMAAKAGRSFGEVFWNAEAGCLYDVINGDFRDGSIRPNQIFAVSLAHSVLSGEKAKRVVEVVEKELLTPLGLRSLSPVDAQYRAHYEGGPGSRDGAYHQGTAWAWLMGPFLTAYIKVNQGSRKARIRAAEVLSAFREHLKEAGLGQISEIFDADSPYRPAGCIAQAWSVAEILRAAIELDQPGQ